MAAVEWPLIRNSQIRALGLAARDAYLERLAAHVAEVFPSHAAFVQRSGGRRFLDRCVDAARRHGLTDQHSVALYTDLVVALGFGFEGQPARRWIAEILEDHGLGSAGKMFLIYNQLRERCPEDPLPPPDVADDDADDDGAAADARPLVPLWPPGDWG
jgi:hypothetical protein